MLRGGYPSSLCPPSTPFQPSLCLLPTTWGWIPALSPLRRCCVHGWGRWQRAPKTFLERDESWAPEGSWECTWGSRTCGSDLIPGPELPYAVGAAKKKKKKKKKCWLSVLWPLSFAEDHKGGSKSDANVSPPSACPPPRWDRGQGAQAGGGGISLFSRQGGAPSAGQPREQLVGSAMRSISGPSPSTGTQAGEDSWVA